MNIQTVGIVGVGAVGSYCLYGLQEALHDKVWVVAEGSRKERLERDGLVINEKAWYPTVKTAEASKGVDLIIVAVKYGALAEAAEMVQAMAGPHTIVMSLMNGVESEEYLGAHIGMDHIVPAMIKISSARQGNKISFNPQKTPGIFYGKGRKGKEENVAALRDLFQRSQLRATESEEIERTIWYKFALNVSKNLPQAIIGCGFGAYAVSSHVEALSNYLREEVVAVAKAKGFDISEKDKLERKEASAAFQEARFSTLQDLDAKRHTEIEMFAGAMMRMGEALGIPTPYNTFTYHIIKGLEEKNDGLFDFSHKEKENE